MEILQKRKTKLEIFLVFLNIKMSTKSKKIELTKEFMATCIETEMKKTKV